MKQRLMGFGIEAKRMRYFEFGEEGERREESEAENGRNRERQREGDLGARVLKTILPLSGCGLMI